MRRSPVPWPSSSRSTWNEPVPLRHLTGAGADDVDGAPPRVAEDLATVIDGLQQLLGVVVEVVDPLLVVDPAVRLHLVVGAQPVLGDEQGHLVAVPQLVADVPEPHRILRPPEAGGLQVRVLRPDDARGVVLRFVAHREGGRPVVAESEVVAGVLPDQLEIAVYIRNFSFGNDGQTFSYFSFDASRNDVFYIFGFGKPTFFV